MAKLLVHGDEKGIKVAAGSYLTRPVMPNIEPKLEPSGWGRPSKRGHNIFVKYHYFTAGAALCGKHLVGKRLLTGHADDDPSNCATCLRLKLECGKVTNETEEPR